MCAFQNELEDSLHKLELENAKLDAALKHETQKVEMLSKDLENSNQVSSFTCKCMLIYASTYENICIVKFHFVL